MLTFVELVGNACWAGYIVQITLLNLICKLDQCTSNDISQSTTKTISSQINQFTSKIQNL